MSTATMVAAPEKHIVVTSDDWKIALFHYRPMKSTRNYPILMVHGIASDHHVWDIGVEGYNLAPHLAEQGYDVFAIDLRGRSGSDGPHTGRGSQWSVDDYLVCDLPKAVKFILEKTGKPRLHWVGHSLGGLMSYFYQIRHKHFEMQSITTFASAVTYTYSTINMIRNWVDYITFLPYLPVGRMWRIFSPLPEVVDPPWNSFLWERDNMTPAARKAVIEKVMHNIGIFEWNQLKTISTSEGMPRISDGTRFHTFDDRRIVVPSTLLAGSKGWIWPLDGIEWTDKNLKSESKLIVFGKDYGHRSDYGHMDLVCGIHAPIEVWPIALAAINERDAL